MNIDTTISSIARCSSLIPRDCVAYRQRNAVERMFAKPKDYRRVATSYDKLAEGCTKAQGYYFGVPEPAENAMRHITGNRRLRVVA